MSYKFISKISTVKQEQLKVLMDRPSLSDANWNRNDKVNISKISKVFNNSYSYYWTMNHTKQYCYPSHIILPGVL